MDSLSKEGEEPALILIPIVATLFLSLSDGGRPYKEDDDYNDVDDEDDGGGRPYKEEVRPSEEVKEDDEDGREEQEDCLDLRMN